jgi:hypothetical protein
MFAHALAHHAHAAGGSFVARQVPVEVAVA